MTSIYEGYTVKLKQLPNGYWAVALSNRDGSAKASSTSFHTEDQAMEWAKWRVDGLRSLGIV